MEKYVRKLPALAIALLLLFMLVPVAMAKDVTIGLAWDANVETNLGGYGAYVSDTPGEYTETNKFADILAGTEEIWYTYDAIFGTSVTKYFVVDAHNDDDPPLRSGKSNEVHWVYDMRPFVAVKGLKVKKVE